jgi:uncharacterized protein (TIGR03437 family)
MKSIRLLVVCAALGATLLVHAQGVPSPTLNGFASKVLGNPGLTTASVTPNLVEGRELFSPFGIAVDTSVTPNVLYIADTRNNRVLGWRDINSALTGSPASFAIGQRDLVSTFPLGPGSSFTNGLNFPGGLAVDGRGQLYVFDSGNNRIVRYEKPYEQPADFIVGNMVIGQPNFNSRARNQNNPTPSEQTLGSGDSGRVFVSEIKLDSTGNLWVADTGNNRVIRFGAGVLEVGRNNASADLVLGQRDFQSAQPNFSGIRNKDVLNAPNGIAISPDGRVYVSDSTESGRIVVYRNATTGAAAERIFGLLILSAGQTATFPNDTNLRQPEGLMMIGNRVAVCDQQNHRILIADAPEQWPAESTEQFSPRFREVIGQNAMVVGRPNRSNLIPNESGFNQPNTMVVAGNNLLVADSGNNRVLAIPLQGGMPRTPAVEVIGQLRRNFSMDAPNLVEGREFNFTGDGSGVANGNAVLDGTTLYVADTYNNRVLVFRDVQRKGPGAVADQVIGQPDFNRTVINYPSGDPDSPSSEGLFRPFAVAIDPDGNLWVADSGNGRVLRYANPTTQSGAIRPNLVIGQRNFVQKITDASNSTMSNPTSIAFAASGHLLVADGSHNRVLFFRKLAGVDLTNGQAAEKVFGQPNFTTITAGNTSSRLNLPRSISLDGDDRLVVADSGNNRIVFFDRVPNAPNQDGSSALQLGFSSPSGVFANRTSGEFWIAESGGSGFMVRLPNYQQLVVNANQGAQQFQAIISPGLRANALGVTLDPLGNLLTADSANRIIFQYQSASVVNAANNIVRDLAPGMLSTIFSAGVDFTDRPPAAAVSLPLSRDLADVAITINDTPVPLLFVGSRQINFQVPTNIAPGTEFDMLIQRASTRQVLAAVRSRMAEANPGLFIAAQEGIATQAAALNQDNTVNNRTNPVRANDVIILYGTGGGAVLNGPADGGAATGPTPFPVTPQVFINLREVDRGNILYAGLAPGFPGVFQINVRVPETVPASNNIPVLIVMRSVPSTVQGGTVSSVATIAVRRP